MRFWLGGYTARSGGNATGIGVLDAGAADDILAGGQLRFAGDAVAADGSPSWVAQHPDHDVVYVAIEDAGTVRAYRRTGERTLEPFGAPVEAGEAVCHVAVAPDGGSLVASCWGDGRVVRIRLDAGGKPSASAIGAAGSDPYGPAAEHASVPQPEEAASRASRAHQAIFLPGGLVASTDMGWDLVRFWRADAAGLRELQQVVLPRGSGPRHTVWHPSGHLYVVTELSREVFALAPDPTGRWRVVAGSTLGVGTLDGDTAAELAASRDGHFLYAGVRGSNTIATVRVKGAGDSLAPVALVDSGVDWPRHHAIARDTLLVAGQRSDEVASLTLDVRTGVPGRVRHRVQAPSPTCLLPARS